MKNIAKTIIIASVISLMSYAGFFLDNGIGLKGMQVGGAYTANPDGGEALYWNVANLINSEKNEFYFSYAKKYDDMTDYSFIYSMPSGEGSAIGVGYFKSGVDGNIERNSSGNMLSTFQFIDNAYFLGYAQQLPFDHSYGVTLKMISQKAIDSASYMSIDIGYKLMFGMIHIGLVGQDIFISGKNTEIKPTYRAGVSTELIGFILSGDYIYSMLLSKGFTRYGIIYKGFPMLSVKAGYNEYDQNLYAGLTMELFGFHLDYLYSNPDLGVVHQFGFGIEI